MLRRILLLLAIHAPGVSAPAGPAVDCDICVFGATSGGVVAAVQAARMGKSVVLVEPGRHVGGMTSGGLSLTDYGNINSIGGLSLEFYRRVGLKYGFTNTYWASPVGSQYRWYFDPSTAETVFTEMLAEAKVPVYFNQQLVSVAKTNQRLTHLATAAGLAFRARMFIDATYEGDLMAAAGVTFTVGRESSATYGESLAGVVNIGNGGYNFDPYLVPGNPASGVLPLVSPTANTNLGASGPEVQSYNFRLCVTQAVTNQIPLHLTPPTGYSEARYELMGRYIQARIARHGSVTLDDLLTLNGITPNGKVDVNNGPGGVSTDFVGESKTWATNTYAGREVIRRAHEDYMRGLLYYLANGAGVPANIKTEMRSWGLAKDEFTDNNGWPHQLYIREARRLVGDYVMQQQNSVGQRIAGDSIGLASYAMDSHACQRFPMNGLTYREGGMFNPVPRPFPISYRSIIPRVGKCENVFATFALSASHVAFGACRMEPVFMITSQSAATAAAFAIEDNVPVQQLNYPKLALQLAADGQILAWDWGLVSTNTATNSVVIDNADSGVTKVGAWSTSSSTAGYWGVNYFHDSNTGGGKSVTFTTTMPTNGTYEVDAWWTAASNRATNATFSIISPRGRSQVAVNQTLHGSVWVKLCVTNFLAGESVSVTLTNENAGGYVIADAVRFAPAASAPAGSTTIVIDNNDPAALKLGSWSSSAELPGYWGANYLHDGNTGSAGGKSVTFTAAITTAGFHEVAAWWTALSNRASNVPILIAHPAGTTTVFADQTVNGSTWVKLLATNFAAGGPASVTITNANANGYVIADAVRFTTDPAAAVIVQVLASDVTADKYQTNQGRFTLVRSGDTTAPLNLVWTFGGTATSGVDYATLPTAMFLPPGVTSTNLLVTPLPDASSGHIETLTLTLQPGSNYSVGSLGTATITILDSPPSTRPVINYFGLASNGWLMSLVGNPSTTYQIQSATSLQGPWEAIGSILTTGSGSAAYLTPNAPQNQVFYRLLAP